MVFPISSYVFTPGAGVPPPGDNIGQVVSRSIVVKVPPSCVSSELLDVAGFVVTSSNGTANLRVTAFLCPNEAGRQYKEPVNIVATAASATPIVVTVTHSLVTTPPSTDAADVQINIFTWDAKGAPAPNVGVNWRCRVSTGTILF